MGSSAGGESLIYQAKTIRLAYVMILMMLITIFPSIDGELWMLYYLIPFALFVLISRFLDFRLEVADGCLTYKIRVFTFTIYHKTVSHQQIKMMTFKRAGWSQKCVIVKHDKGFNFRILNFTPKNIYDELMEFGSRYEIPMNKTKDYLLLEKMK